MNANKLYNEKEHSPLSLAKSLTFKFPYTNTLAEGLIEKTLSMLHEMTLTTMHKDKDGG